MVNSGSVSSNPNSGTREFSLAFATPSPTWTGLATCYKLSLRNTGMPQTWANSGDQIQHCCIAAGDQLLTAISALTKASGDPD